MGEEGRQRQFEQKETQVTEKEKDDEGDEDFLQEDAKSPEEKCERQKFTNCHRLREHPQI